MSAHPTWTFLTLDGGRKQRDPTQGEFFNGEAIDSQARELVREAIQNSLDARRDAETVRIRIYVSGSEGALDPDTAQRDLEGLWEHVAACAEDYADDLFGAPCPYVVIEDYGTTGLTGDTTDPFNVDREPNNFFSFFRAEGASSKGGTDKGRWGLGKFVFPKNSDLLAFYAVTCQHPLEGHPSDRLLLGQAVLRFHSIDQAVYEPDGWWAAPRSSEAAPFLPIEDPQVIDDFSNRWNVGRKDGEGGLSIVIPYADRQLTPEGLAEAVIAEYFVAIARDNLRVLIESPDDTVTLDASTLDHHVARLDARSGGSVTANISLLRWYDAIDPGEIIHVGQASGGRWEHGLIDESRHPELLAVLRAGDRVAFSVPVEVHRKRGNRRWSSVTVLAEGLPAGGSAQTFIRGGIMVPDVRPTTDHPGVRSVLLAEEEAIVEMLGDAEDPGHTRWNERGDHFRGKYEKGRDWLRFVKRLPGNLVRALRSSEDERAEDLLTQWLSVPAEAGAPAPGPGGDGGDGPPPEPDIRVSPQAQPWSARRTTDGTLRLQRTDGASGATVRLTLAYDVARGDPFRRYSPIDFHFGDPDEGRSGHLDVDADHTDWIVVAPNAVRLSAQTADASVTISGLDPHRDVRLSLEVDE